jgi:putative methyltransferase (TIGR04325 family)
MQKVTGFIKNWLPPAMVSGIQKVLVPKPVQESNNDVFWQGDYPTWEAALTVSMGYSSENILEKVKASTLKVKTGEVAYERDSFIFNKIQYSWECLAGLMWVAARDGGRLDVLDFGGSLGSSYFQNRKFLAALKEVHWNVVEQPHFVDCGREHIQDDVLHFYSTISESLIERNPNVILSGVLSHIPDWLSLLQTILAKKIPTVVVDRTPFVLEGSERITVQTVPEWIYEATYPCRFLNEDKFRAVFAEFGYHLVEDFIALDTANIPSIYKGFMFVYQVNPDEF